MDAEDTLTHPLPPLVKSASRNSIDEGVSWFHGKILRDEAERILLANGNIDGLFLVRESSSSPGDYVLSLVYNKEPVHYQIRRHGGDAFFSIDGGPIVHGLEMLISYYQEDAVGLSTKLGQMCKGQPPPSDSRRHGRTNLLHRATKEGEVTVVRELVKSGYHNLDAKNQEGQTSVHLASIMGFDDILEVLLNVGANPSILDGNGLTPLHYAAQNNLPSTMSVLIKYDANPQVRASGSGWVPLHYAADKGYSGVVKLLLSLNCPCHPRSNYNETPMDLALKNNHHECYALLKNHIPAEPLYPQSEWFHENLDREGTIERFRDNGFKDGSFLVRRSTRKRNFYVLSVVSNKNTFNYEIQNKDKFYFIDDGPYLESLDHVVDYYRRIPDGLPTNLVCAVPPEVALNNNHQTCEQTIPKPPPVKNCVSNGEKSPESCAVNGSDVQSSCPVSKPNLICRESLKLGLSVGEGEFGSVLQGTWINQNNTEVAVAIKTLRDEQMQSCREEFIREVEVMVGLNHCCIVKLLGVCLGPPLMMVQELVPMGSLLDYVLDHSTEIHLQDMLIWSAQIAWGMTYLESKRFVHRDLAARNILLSSKTQAKISDFGLSRALRSGSEYYRASTGGRWPVKWYAPESINYGTFSHASDMWSYGITLWEIITLGEPPYGDMTGTEVIQLIEANNRLEIPESCPVSIKSIIQQCWLYMPERRPTFKMLYKKFCSEPEYCCIWEFIK
ncbi:tyrosine-protein kinase HTK16 isoform X2 [Parasteatoda tepidariorum]|uniref:tyrosine-protein kinase HTK16 isoform X2 n=1 Tax=Parasteatoda tepidariorum TaxID=114398 RepID=UPI00077FC93D|nr:tyrosine-protein kinase HTK16 isoform X2 [Parasteatoda tepidariorum]